MYGYILWTSFSITNKKYVPTFFCWAAGDDNLEPDEIQREQTESETGESTREAHEHDDADPYCPAWHRPWSEKRDGKIDSRQTER